MLEQNSSDWYKAEQIRRLGNCLECKINEVTDEEKREKLLGKSKHIFELIEHEDF